MSSKVVREQEKPLCVEAEDLNFPSSGPVSFQKLQASHTQESGCPIEKIPTLLLHQGQSQSVVTKKCQSSFLFYFDFEFRHFLM